MMNRKVFGVIILLFSASPIPALADVRIEVPKALHHDDWVTQGDHPANGASGTVSVLLSIGTDGVPDACEIKKSSKNTELDKYTCAIFMERARFIPGKLNSKPARGTYSDTVHWMRPIN
jgi:TonB family protein